jgi:retinol dehydrogenase 12
VTGGYAGIGFELCKILHAHNATVWIAGRSESKAQKAILDIQTASPQSKGRVEFLYLDLSDLSTIKAAAQTFTSQQQRLDVLVNNAGVSVFPLLHARFACSICPLLQVMYPPKGSIDAHGNELQVGTNCLGPYLLYQLLRPLLSKTVASSPTASVRVLWAGSIAVHVTRPEPHGVALDDDGRPTDQGVTLNYGQTKVGNAFFAREFAKATPQTGVVHAAFNPGNLRTELQRHWTGIDAWLTVRGVLHPEANLCLMKYPFTISLHCRTRLWFIPPYLARTRSFGRRSPPN